MLPSVKTGNIKNKIILLCVVAFASISAFLYFNNEQNNSTLYSLLSLNSLLILAGLYLFYQYTKSLTIDHDATEQKIIAAIKHMSSGKNLNPTDNKYSNFGTWSVDLTTSEIHWSGTAYSIFGYDINEHPVPTTEMFRNIIHEDDREQFMAMTRETAEYGTPIDVEIRIIRPDGEARHVSLRGDTLYNVQGSPILTHGTVLDFTDKVKAEETASKLESRLLEAQRIAGLGHWEWDVINDHAILSDEACRIYDQPIEKGFITLVELMDIVHPDDRDRLSAAVQNTLEKNTPYRVEHRIVHRNGDIITIITQGKVIRNDEGEPLYIIGTAQEITELKKAENAALDAEQKLSEIFDVAPAAIINTDHQMKITIFNKAATEIFGYSAREAIGKHIEILIPQEYREQHPAHIDEFNNSVKQYRNMSERAGIYGLTKDGKKFPAAASVSTTGEGEDKTYTIILLDTTERKRIEEERLLALNEAQNANKAKSQFLATMSHELRTPLNAIIGFSEMMTNHVFGPLGADRYEEYVKDIVGSSRHLLNLVNDILDLSEIESGKKKMNIKHISLKDTMDECQYIIAKLAADKNIKCVYEIPDDLTMIYADKRALKQVLINIMNNAVKFTDRRGTITFKATVERNKHILTVIDNGRGIPKDKLSRVLKPFSRVENDPYKAQEGQGLGLAIVKSLMDLHSGEIKIDSEFGEGTTVKLTFPGKRFN